MYMYILFWSTMVTVADWDIKSVAVTEMMSVSLSSTIVSLMVMTVTV